MTNSFSEVKPKIKNNYRVLKLKCATFFNFMQSVQFISPRNMVKFVFLINTNKFIRTAEVNNVETKLSLEIYITDRICIIFQFAIPIRQLTWKGFWIFCTNWWLAQTLYSFIHSLFWARTKCEGYKKAPALRTRKVTPIVKVLPSLLF